MSPAGGLGAGAMPEDSQPLGSPQPVYCAPAGRILTVLHLAEAGAALDPWPEGHEMTRCGQLMDSRDLWLRVTPRATDRICRACLGLPPQYVQGTLD